MTWGKVDDNFAFHPKVLMAGNDAIGIWVRSLSWSNQLLTDGMIPCDMVTAMNGTEGAKRLVASGLWYEVEGGYQFKDWSDYQPSRESVLAEREVSRKRMADMRAKKSSSTKTQTNTEISSENVQTNFGGSSVTPNPNPTSLSKDREGATRVPSDFAITEAMTEWAKSKNYTVDLETETEKFINYFQALAGKNALKSNWVAAWRNWIIKAQEFRPVTADVDPWAGKTHLGFDS